MASTTSTLNSDYIDADGKTDAEKYLEQIKDGTIIACRHMRRLADILLPRFNEEYHGFVYDRKKAIRPVAWIERYCCFPEGEKMGQPFILEQYERAAIEIAFGFVNKDGYRQYRQVLMMVARKNGKAVSLDTEIPTPDGWKLMRDIHPGDYVFGQDGRPSKVLVESEVFDKPMYLVTFEDGATVKASADHIWTAGRCRADLHDMTTEEIARTLGHELYCIPACAPVVYDEKNFDIVPYDYAKEHCDEVIPDVYLQGSVIQRMGYLAGLHDACGYALYPDCERLRFSNSNAVESCKELLASLGYTHVSTRTHGDGSFDVVFDAGSIANVKWITSVERIPNEPSKCIAIDNESHLYLVGRQYTATHNTSLLAAIMLYMLTSDNPVELGAEVYCCATSESQSRKCFGAADAMRLKSPSLEKRLRRGKIQKRGVSGLNYDKTGSFLVPLAANLGKLDGLSASAVVYDELAAATDNGALLDLLEESTSARRQALTWIISTENYVRENIWDERMEYAKGWLSGEIHDDTFLPILYTLDSKSEIYEESCWPKANPGLLCGVKSWQYLRDRVNRAKQSPRSMPSLLIKEFNLRANSASSFLVREECHNPETFTFNPATDRYGIVGFDLAKGSGDLNAAVCMFMRPGDSRIYEIPHFWISEEAVRINGAKDFKERDGVPYSLWAQSPDNFFTICEGDKVNQRVIIDWIQELANMGLYTRYVGYDSWHVDDWTQRMLSDMVGQSNFEEIPQTAKVLSPAMVEHQVDLRAKRIINPCPTTEWCRSNVQSKPQDANGNWFPQKKDLKPNRRIDGYMAELFAYIELKKHWDDYLQLIGWDKT